MFKSIAVSLVALTLTASPVEGIELAKRHHHKRHHYPSYDYVQSDPICSSAGCTQYNHPLAPNATVIPRDYFVPNFGKDNDMIATEKHILDQEKIFGPWTLKNVTKIDRDYKVPNFGIDSDILNTQNSLKSSEATLDHTWTPVADKNGVYEVPTPFDNKSYSYA